MASFQSWQSRESLFAGLWHRRRRASSGRERRFRKGLAASPQSCGFGPAGIELLEPRQMLATLYWDPDQNAANNNLTTGAGLGGAGTWSDAGGKVWLDPTLNAGKGGYVSWKNASGDKAVFRGPETTTTVTISGTVSAAEIEFGAAGFKVTGGDFTTPAGGTTFSANAVGDFNTPISGTGGITKTGSTTLTLSAPFNAYTGTTQVSAGTLSVSGTIQSHVQVATAGSVQGVMFYDPDLASAVREALALDPKAVLTPALLSQSAALTSLTVDGNVVGDLTGIASLTALTSLELLPSDHAAAPQGIKSLAPLSGLTKLTNLSLQHVGLTDAVLTTLPALSGLARLDLRYNALATVPKTVADMPRLGSLLVHGNWSLTDNPRFGLAALAGKAIDVDVAPDRPDIATTIEDLAACLYRLPLKMLEYVTNTVAYQPYVGAMKGPLATLLTKAGNDWDTNSLLAALYASAGINTRYVEGRAEVTSQQLMDYVGTRDAAAAGNILRQAGLQYDQSYNRFKHTWLEAQVIVPAKVDPAKVEPLWVPLDASWKLRDYRPGLPGVLANVSFSPLESDYLTNSVWQKKSTAEYYEAQVATWLALNRPGLTIADVGYDGPIRQQVFKALPTELPFSAVSQNQVQDTEAYNWKVNIKLASGDSQLFGSLGANLSLADVSLSRLTIDPGLGGTGLSQTVKPVLRQDGATIVTAPTAFAAIASNGLLTQLTLEITVKAPGGGSYTRSFTRAADRFIAIGLDANQFSESLLVEKRAVVNVQQLNRANEATVANEQAVGGLLDLAIAQYFSAADADEAALAMLTSAVPDRTMVALGIATSAAVLSASASDTAGLQFPYLPADIGIDVPANTWGGFAIDASTPTTPQDDRTRDLLMGYTKSSLEGLVLEALTNCESVSTIKAFQLSKFGEDPNNLVVIDKDNVGAINTLLPGVGQEICTAIAKGLEALSNNNAGSTFKALVPKNEITVGGSDKNKQWKGVGYTLTRDSTNPAINGKTLFFMICGSVGNQPLVTYGGASARTLTKPSVPKSTVSTSNPDLSAGDPVNMATGGVYHEETDLEIPNLGVPLAFRRRYDSLHTVSGLTGAQTPWSDRGMGEGWSFTYSDRIEAAADGAGTVTWFTDSGMRLVFNNLDSKTGTFANPAGIFGTLTGSAAAGFKWRDVDGVTTSFGATVGGSCPIVSQSDRFGNGVKIDYVSGTNRIQKVADLRDATRSITFAYNAEARPHISQIKDFTGRVWTYTYLDGRLQTRTAPAVSVVESTASVVSSVAPVVKYEYFSDAARRGLLSKVIDPNGFVTAWEYYANRRGFRVTDTESLQHSFSYNLYRLQSAFIDERGNASRYSYDHKGNLLELQQPDRTAERSTWDTNGLRLTSTDAFGATTAFAYDSGSGKVTSATDPLGNVTTTTYTAGSFRDIATVTRLNRPSDSSDDVTTTCTYDATGFLTSKTDDSGAGRLNLTTTFVAATNRSANGVVPLTVDATPANAGKLRANGVLVNALSGGVNYQNLIGSGTTAIAAQSVAGQNTIVWRNNSTGSLSFWSLDTSWNRTASYGSQLSGSTEFDATERLFGVDFDGDGKVAKGVTPIESIGSMVLAYENDSTARLRVNGFVVNAGAGGVSYSSFVQQGYTAVAADIDARTGQPTIVWRYASGSTEFLTFWRLNTSWNSTAADGQAIRGSEYYYTAEKSFGIDFDGDGWIGVPLQGPKIIEQQGSVSLTIDATENLIANGIGVKAHGSAVSYSDLVFKGYTAVAAENLLGQNTIVWRHTTGFLHFWQFDSEWKVTRTYGVINDGGDDFHVAESRYGADFNGDKSIGLRRGLVAQVITPRGDQTLFAYNAAGQAVSQTLLGLPDGAVTRYSSYDNRGNLSGQIDANGNTTTIAYDALNRQTIATAPDPDGPGPLTAVATAFSYDRSGNLLAAKSTSGIATRSVFDKRDRETRTILPDGTYTLATFDAAGNKVTETDALGRTTRYKYDSRNRLSATLLPDGSSTRTTFDGGGRLVALADGNGATTTYEYDKLGRKTRETQPDPDGAGPLAAPVTAWGYDSRGNVEFVTPLFVGQGGVTAGDGNRSTYFIYDALGRVLSETQPDPDGSGPMARPVTLFGYQDTGLDVRSRKDSRGFWTTSIYDAFGRKTKEIFDDPDGAGPLGQLVKQFVYDANGNLRFEIAPGGATPADTSFVTEHRYDGLNREVQTTLPDPDGSSGPLTRPISTRSFDARGFLATTTDALNRTVAFVRDLFGRALSVQTARGTTAAATTFTIYDAVGNAIVTTDELGRKTVRSRDARDRVLSIRGPRPTADSQAPVTSWVYDVTGNPLKSIDALGRTSWQQFDALGRLVAETDALGTSAGDSSHTRRTEYDSAGRVTATFDELGRRTETSYDNLGRRKSVRDPSGGTTFFGYDAAGNLTTVTNPLGFVTTTAYDGLGRKFSTTTPDPDGGGPLVPLVTQQVYDAIGRLAASVDELSRRTDYGYDNLGRRTSETAPDPDGAGPLARPVTSSTYDAVGNRTSVKNPLGNVTTYVYDALNRRTKVIDALKFETVTSYDAVGNTTSLTDASGNVTSYTYDRLNRLITETDPLKAVTTFAYDLVGNKTRETDRLGRVTSFIYDAADRLVEERWQATSSAVVSHTIQRIYDAADQLLGVTETDTANPAATTAWQYTYDAAGNVVKSRMAPGELLQQPGFVSSPTSSGSLADNDITIDWDGDGKAEPYDLYQQIDVAIGDQLLLTASSTAFDPVLFLQKPGQGLTSALFDDSSGGGTAARLLVTADVAGTWLFAVTARDELATGAYTLQIVKDQNAIVPTALVAYDFTYDKAGNLVASAENQAAVAQFSVSQPSGQSIKIPAATGLDTRALYTVDALNRVVCYQQADVSGAITKRVDYGYRGDATADWVRRYAGDGTSAIGSSTAAYDGLGRLTGITNTPAATGSASIAYGYSYDAASRITGMTTPEGTSSFTLDATDQLKSASLTSEKYDYDKTGNRTSGSTQTSTGNRLLFDGTYRYVYDAEGNRTAKFRDTNAGGTLSVGDTDITLYGYDQRNRLVSVSHVSAWAAAQAGSQSAFRSSGTALPGSDLELRYTYDYADRRIRRSFDGDGAGGTGRESVSFVAYAGSVRTLEIAQTATVSAGGRVIGFISQVGQRNFYGNGEDEILAVDKITWTDTATTPTPKTSTYWTFTDHQNSVRDIVSGTPPTLGQVVEHRQYDSFGRMVRQTTGPQAGAATTPGVGIDFGYAGRPLEARTGLSDNRARWYEPGTGKFINEDPSGFEGGDANLFRYVGNDPLNQVDPSGLTGKYAQSAGRSGVAAAGFGAYGAGGQDFSNLYGSLGKVFDRQRSQQSQPANSFTGKTDRGNPFGEFIVNNSSASGGARVGQSNFLVIGVDGTGSEQWLSKVDASGSLVNQRTQPDGSTRWNSHVRNLVADSSPFAMTIYSPGPARTDGRDSKDIYNRVISGAEMKIRESGGDTRVAVVGFSRGAMIASGVAAALANPPAGSIPRNVVYVGMYDPVDMSSAVDNNWARIDARVKNVMIVGPNSGRKSTTNVDYPEFFRMSLDNRISTAGNGTQVSRVSYNASHGALGGTPGFNKRVDDSGTYNYAMDAERSILADERIRDGMRAAGMEFVPKRNESWYGFPATRPPKELRE